MQTTGADAGGVKGRTSRALQFYGRKCPTILRAPLQSIGALQSIGLDNIKEGIIPWYWKGRAFI
jgi:hypothetical protein